MDLYQVFHDPPAARGNFASIALVSHDDGAPEHPASPALAHCHARHHEHNQYTVSCYQQGHKIQCCGHGLLAAAHAIFRSSDHEQLNFGSGIYAERLRDPGALQQTRLHLPALRATRFQIPDWVQGILSDTDGTPIAPLSAAAGDDLDGYLLLQLDDRALISELGIDLRAISKNTRRAVLLWQRRREETDTVRTRYFAPQYGNDEDAATGSVLRILMPYLQQVCDLTAVTVIQCSSMGGRMTAQMIGDSVAVSGNVQLVDSKELPAQWQIQK